MTWSTRISAALLASSLLLTACSGGSGGGSIFVPSPTPTPGSPATAFTCPSSTSAFAVTSSAAGVSSEARSMPPRRGKATTAENALTVTYDAAHATQIEPYLDARAASYGARKLGALSFDRLGTVVRVLAVGPSKQAAVKAMLETVPGVKAVAAVQRRYAMRVTNPFITNDPYFSSRGQASAPLYETAAIPGQWDMHVMGLEHAFAYSQAGNGSGITNSNALGSTSVRLAVIDTGMDVTQLDLAANNIARTRCFITDTSNVQSTGTFVTDPQGHGTDVTGIAGADVNNGFGFAGAGGNISLLLYRVFPTPNDTCLTNTSNNTDPQCGAADIDIASAINDAVANGANVISMSLGGGSCTAGQDPSQLEGNAVANAIAHNVIVTAASGNEGVSTPDAPGCDAGVISVGASAYNDGVANGSGFTGGRTEYVASYTNQGSTIVAPGGDPTSSGTSSSDNDDLHWIENIWTSTPFDSNFAGACNTDFYAEANNCRILIAGTSMATPHVAGAAALVLSVNSNYQSPSAMRTLLCGTADSIGDPQQGCGRINVYRAVAKALNDPTLP